MVAHSDLLFYKLGIRTGPASGNALSRRPPRDGPLSLGHAPPLALHAPGQLVHCHLGSNRYHRKNDEYFFLMTHHAPCSEISVFYCRTETVSNHFLHLILIVLKN